MEKSYGTSERQDKLVDWLGYSRDRWKTKYSDAKLELKQQVLANKRAREGRDLLKKKLAEAKNSIKKMEILLKDQTQQIEELKKKGMRISYFPGNQGYCAGRLSASPNALNCLNGYIRTFSGTAWRPIYCFGGAIC